MYEDTRTIGFNLKGDIAKVAGSVAGQGVSLSKRNEDELSEKFLDAYHYLLTTFSDVVFYHNAQNERCVTDRIKVKYTFLKSYAREVYERGKRGKGAPKEYHIRDLHDVFTDWYERNRELYKSLEEKLRAPEESQARRADILMILKKLDSHDYLPLVRDFVRRAKHTREEGKLEDLRHIVERCADLLGEMKYLFAPTQRDGVEVARGSFNYFTVNKSAAERDVGNQRDVLRKELEKLFSDIKQKETFLENVGYVDSHNIHDKLRTVQLENAGFDSPHMSLKEFKPLLEDAVNTVNQLHAELQNFKSTQRSLFNQGVQKYISDGLPEEKFPGWVKKHFPLFHAAARKGCKPEEELVRFFRREHDMRRLNTQKAQRHDVHDCDARLQKIKNQHNQFFRFCRSYKQFNDLRREVAQYRGRLRAQLYSIEQEITEARLLKYWAFIRVDGKKKFLVLIPKERRAEVLRDLRRGTRGDVLLYEFRSFTLRALEKMLRKEFPKMIPDFNKDALRFIDMVKRALRGGARGIDLRDSLLDFKDEVEYITGTRYETKEELRHDFDRLFYKIHVHQVDRRHLQRWGALEYEVTSYDQERALQSEPKPHTKLWYDFWTACGYNDHTVRLNPEFRIFYRDVVPQDDPEGKKSRNRFAAPKLQAWFTLTRNPGSTTMRSGFVPNETLKEQVERFNTEVISSWEKGLETVWYFGIDRGNKELATLGVMSWGPETYRVETKSGPRELLKPRFAKFDTYTIRDNSSTIVTTKEVLITKNPSHFMMSEDAVQQYFICNKGRSFIDLTTAKLIKGRIVENGDIHTYLNLKRANAKRKLFNEFVNIDPAADVAYSGDETHPMWGNHKMRHALVIKNKTGSRQRYTLLCYFTPQQREKFGENELERLQYDLREYLNELRRDPKRQAVSIEQINHLRDAITANMVGIIAHLFKTFPGYIRLENLLNTSHFDKNNENIENRLEWALYRKFQKEVLVPPYLRNTDFLRKDAKINRFGIIHFVETENTSAKCPRCFEKADENKRKAQKWSEHNFTCTNPRCGFSTAVGGSRYEFGPVGNSDEVASCNIANPEFDRYNTKSGTDKK